MEKKQEDAQNQNEDIQARNETVAKMKTFVKFIVPEEEEPDEINFEEWDEKCFITVQNYREMHVNEAGDLVAVAANDS